MKIVAKITGKADDALMIETAEGIMTQSEVMERVVNLPLTLGVTGERIGRITRTYTKDGYVMAEIEIEGTIPW